MVKKKYIYVYIYVRQDSPGSEASILCCEAGACDRGPGVPGDLTSSFTGPPYDSDEEGGLCNQKQYLRIHRHIQYNTD